MRRRVATLLAIAGLVSAWAVPAGAEQPSTVTVTITNLADNQPISPPVVVTHHRNASFFEVGKSASAGLEAIAENGDPSVAFAAFDGAPHVTGVVNVGQPLTRAGTTFNGFTDSVTFEIAAQRSDVLSLAGMLICTNDGFSGGDDLAIPRRGTFTYFLNGYDAGTELNTEASADIVDACSLLGPVVLAGDDNGNSNDGIDENAPIAPHGGIAGAADLLLDHNWDDPVLMVSITRG